MWSIHLVCDRCSINGRCSYYYYCSDELLFVYSVLLSNFFSLQLYSSSEFGRRWQLIQEGVVPNRFYW